MLPKPMMVPKLVTITGLMEGARPNVPPCRLSVLRAAITADWTCTWLLLPMMTELPWPVPPMENVLL